MGLLREHFFLLPLPSRLGLAKHCVPYCARGEKREEEEEKKQLFFSFGYGQLFFVFLLYPPDGSW
jgi:hypothetical protein